MTWSSSAVASSGSPRRSRAPRRPHVPDRRRRARSRAGRASVRQQLQRHPFRAVLRARQPQGEARRAGQPRDHRVLPLPTTFRTRCAARSWSPPGPTSSRAWPSSHGAVATTASTVAELTLTELARLEPHVRAIAALHVPSTGICDFRLVTEQLGRLLVGRRRRHLHESSRGRTRPARRRSGRPRAAGRDAGTSRSGCAGLRCDELAKASGADPQVRIVPVPGRVLELRAPAADLVRGLVYPVPDPAFPFLGVHATRGIDGPCRTSARTPCLRSRARVFVARRQAGELARTLAYPGLLRLARKHWRYGLGEVHRSLSRRAR